MKDTDLVEDNLRQRGLADYGIEAEVHYRRSDRRLVVEMSPESLDHIIEQLPEGRLSDTARSRLRPTT